MYCLNMFFYLFNFYLFLLILEARLQLMVSIILWVQARMLWSKLKLVQAKVQLFWYITDSFYIVVNFVSNCFFSPSTAVVKHKQLPAIETVLKASSNTTIQRVPPIYVLILCPTRELASQLAAEANAMLKYHDGICVQTLVGGTRFKDDQKRLESDPCQVYLHLC